LTLNVPPPNGPPLPASELKVLDAIRRWGSIATRIKELGYGDVEYVQLPLATWPADRSSARVEAVADDEVLTCLHSLHDRGLVERNTQVHGASPTEYICEWTLRRPDDLSRGPGGALSGDLVKPRYACGDVQLDAAEFVAYVNRRRVLLTAAQAQLLLQLMNHAGRTLTRGELAGVADAAGVEPRAVDVQVARLRRKLAGARQFAIETVRGVGYRCVESGAPGAPARLTRHWQ
jgi:hypothetical protein